MSQFPPKFFLTTPIYYVNARPHIGHAYTTIVADVIARRSRAQGVDTWFLTGTDEHGQKIERSAAAAGIPPQEFTDKVSATFREPWRRMGITNDDFIRTTEPRHIQGVQKLFTTLEQNGYIDLQTYTGAYCVSDEAFVDVPAGTPCPECGNITEVLSESNFYFKLSAFQEQILDLIQSNTLVIQPDTLRNEVLSFVRGDFVSELRKFNDEGGKVPDGYLTLTKQAIESGRLKQSASGATYVPGALKDLSISRTSIKWGIPVPGHPDHVIYVWLDALANYMTAVGYGSDKPEDIAKFERYWPADLHLIGKEIARFHCVYWPAFLLAANLPLPKTIAANGWLLFHDTKMSKSKGNVVRIETILDGFGTRCPATPAELPSLLSSRSEAEGSASALPSPAGDRKGTPSGVPQTAQEDAGALAPEVRSLSGATETIPQRLKPQDNSGVDGTGEPVPFREAPSKAQQDLFASDVLRYFLLREIPFGQDGNFSLEAMVTRYNADLANGYGNLVSRTLNMIHQYFDGYIPTGDGTRWTPFSDPSLTFDWNRLSHLDARTYGYGDQNNAVKDADDFDFSQKITLIISGVALCDSTLTQTAPWKLIKDPLQRETAAAILRETAESIRIITALLYPILPYATASVWRQLGLGDIEEAAHNGRLKDLEWGGLKPGTQLGPLAPIFPRADKGLTAIMIQMEQDQNTPISHANAAHDAAAITFSEFPEMSLASAIAPHPNHEKSVPLSSESVVSLSHSDASPQITIDDFAKVELRVAKVLVAERIPKADKLLRLEVDLGYEQRQILSGIAEWYTPEELIGRRIVVITNLAPRKMRGLESHGMLLAASTEGGKPHLATFADSEALPLGSRLK